MKNTNKRKKKGTVQSTRIWRLKNPLRYRIHNFMSSLRKHKLPTPTLEEITQLVEIELGKKCRYCLEKLTVKSMSIDHSTPISRNGDNSINNLHVICQVCNKLKSDLTELEFKSFLTYLYATSLEARSSIIKRLGMSSVIYRRRK